MSIWCGAIILGLILEPLLFAQTNEKFHNVVSEFGCVGDGKLMDGIWEGTNNDACFGFALAKTRDSHGVLFFPSGIYLYKDQPLLIKNGGSIFSSTKVVGEDVDTTVIVHSGGGPAAATIDFEPASPDSAFFNAGVKDITVIGGSRDKYVIKDNAGAHMVIRDVRTAGSTDACFYMYEAVGGYLDNVACDEFTADNYGGQAIVSMPRNGIELEGSITKGGEYYSTPFQIISPRIEGVSEIALDIEAGAQVVVSACQISGNKQSLKISDQSYSNSITSCLFENEETGSYIGGHDSEIVSSIFSNIKHPSTGITINGRGNTLRSVSVGSGPIEILSTASNTSIISCMANELPSSALKGVKAVGIADQGAGTTIVGLHYSTGVSGARFSQNESAPAASNNEPGLGVNTVHTASSVWLAGTMEAPTPVFSTTFSANQSWALYACGKFGNGGASGDMLEPPCIELTESENSFTSAGGYKQYFAVDGNGVLGYYSVSNGKSGDYFDGVITFIPDITSSKSGAISQMWSGFLQTPGFLGPVIAPIGACTLGGAWVLSQDGHMSFCSSGRWVRKM